ncbi:Sugar phosphatase YidA [Candidatus Erwinia haradaeae]|uniref:Sugar phosphatase YidA n=1 Tax=Candidatus Erwinia haradaeae TaxID=1922217 RepID=A0A451CYJ7_9GAMM|nr:sugar-phosphatase [Candidatus Erwinia haradaeae]VFP78459.1 Sugar phosphatase YidA [Candidatus Erwinia haradaeae]
MAIRLIAIDIDGTLLNQKREITLRVQQAVRTVNQRGVAIILATGRPFIGIQRYLKELELNRDDQYCITNNGALVQNVVNGESLLEVLLTFDDYLYCEYLSRVLNVHFQAFSKKEMFTSNKDISKYTVREAWMTGIPLRYCDVSDMDSNLMFPKLMMIDSSECLDSAVASLPIEVFKQFNIMKSAPCYLEILNKRVNKGFSLSFLAKKMGLNRKEVMAIGDQENDLAMLEYAGTSVAMGNSIDVVKEAAKFVTNSNQEDGVARAIEEFLET